VTQQVRDKWIRSLNDPPQRKAAADRLSAAALACDVEERMTGTRRIRLLALLAAVGLAVAPAAATAQAASSSPPVSPAASTAPDAKTFTVGILQDVDSMNPFVGIVAEAY
jgi:peptide/nickel transport system substrate-binding protein